MIDPTTGPFLFDTSAEGWLGRSGQSGVVEWIRTYLLDHEIYVSAVTALERIRGYSLLWHRAEQNRREQTEAARIDHLTKRGQILPLDAAVAVVAGEIMALLPEPPTAPPPVSSTDGIAAESTGALAV